MNILFVCTANTCRSPMAAAIMEKIAIENDIDVLIESAGIFAQIGERASDEAIAALDEMGIDLTYHRSKPVSEDLVKKSDLILTMTEGHKKILEGLSPKKVYSVMEYIGATGDIADPYGGDIEEYRETAKEIYDVLVDVAEKIVEENDNH